MEPNWFETVWSAAVFVLASTTVWVGLFHKIGGWVADLFAATALDFEGDSSWQSTFRFLEWLFRSWSTCALCGGFWAAIGVRVVTDHGFGSDSVVLDGLCGAACVAWMITRLGGAQGDSSPTKTSPPPPT